jgi:hypothetical protein
MFDIYNTFINFLFLILSRHVLPFTELSISCLQIVFLDSALLQISILD